MFTIQKINAMWFVRNAIGQVVCGYEDVGETRIAAKLAYKMMIRCNRAVVQHRLAPDSPYAI